MTFKQVTDKLLENGWRWARTKGSHHAYKKPGCTYLAVVPEHGGKDLSIGVLKNLEEGTGLSLLKR